MYLMGGKKKTAKLEGNENIYEDELLLTNGSNGHYSVLLEETVDALNIDPDGIYVDCTLGGGGHSERILKKLCEKDGKGKLYSFDRDSYAIEKASERLSKYKDKFTAVKGNFANGVELLSQLGAKRVNGVTADLGVSSFQLDEKDRGFSYMQDAPLDMRMSRGEGKSAADVIADYSEEELRRIISSYGEESFASRIASFIVREREKHPIETTGQLCEIIKSAIPAKNRKTGHHPAKKTFQAIRIEVNGELEILEGAINDFFGICEVGARMAFITFHSLEDRIVKHSFASFAQGCTCPPEFPVCVCHKTPFAQIISRKPVLPSEKELIENPRSRSAKLRICEKIKDSE